MNFQSTKMSSKRNQTSRHSDQRHQRSRSPRNSEFGRPDQHHFRPHPKRAKSINNWNQDHTSRISKDSRSTSPTPTLAFMMEDRSTDLRSYLKAKTSVSQKISNPNHDQPRVQHVTFCEESQNSSESLLQQKLEEMAELRHENERLKKENMKLTETLKNPESAISQKILEDEKHKLEVNFQAQIDHMNTQIKYFEKLAEKYPCLLEKYKEKSQTQHNMDLETNFKSDLVFSNQRDMLFRMTKEIDDKISLASSVSNAIDKMPIKVMEEKVEFIKAMEKDAEKKESEMTKLREDLFLKTNENMRIVSENVKLGHQVSSLVEEVKSLRYEMSIIFDESTIIKQH